MTEGNRLPNTASNAFNIVLSGLFLLLTGSLFYLIQRRKLNV
ncbi:LPXTG cell wall anchor domain-containing protein [Aquibacillus halophilus]